MTDKQKQKCKMIIHTHATAAAGVAAGMAQLPAADNLPLAGIEISMVS
ncbi:MAG: hypothetical protein ACI3ZY_13540 [Parabacteroides sp.]